MPSTNGHSPNSGAERVALYLRVSSEGQKTKETIETQHEFLEEYCKLYRHEVANIYKDEAVSGTVPLPERSAGRELLEDAKAGKFDVVLVYKLDRIGRKLLVVVDAYDRLIESGVALRSATEPIDTSTPAGRLIFQMLASFAEFEKETINERTRDGKNRTYRNGAQPGIIPYGYEIKMLKESVEADLAREEQDAAAERSTAMWLMSLRGNLEVLEEDTNEAWHGRRELVEQLVEQVTVSRTEDGRDKVDITYKFAPPVQVASGVTDHNTFEILAGDTPIREALAKI